MTVRTVSFTILSAVFTASDRPTAFAYCGDHLADYNVVYIKGAGSNLADMDIDCDGEQNGRGDDGRCGSSSDTQSITSFQDRVKGYKKGINDLNAFIHPYVVFGNEGSKKGWKTFDPEEYGIEPLSIIAVVCNGKLVSLTPSSCSLDISNRTKQIYGIWGDENGDDGDKPMVGEASISMATACFGTSMNGNNGHVQNDVMYIAFPGSEAVPGANGANWGATSWSSFESSIEALGNKLIQRIGGGSSGGGGGTTPSPTCEWEGHCEGAACTTDDDCSDPWGCVSGKCALDGGSPPLATTKAPIPATTKAPIPATTKPSTPTQTCEWAGHCAGATCKTNDDCSDPWACISGKCALDPAVGGGGSTPNYYCNWSGHCEGAACTDDDSCGNNLYCETSEKVCTMEGCEWAGHCLGAKCSSNDDCSDPYECNASVGYCWHAS
jgi:hypothetical protein